VFVDLEGQSANGEIKPEAWSINGRRSRVDRRRETALKERP